MRPADWTQKISLAVASMFSKMKTGGLNKMLPKMGYRKGKEDIYRLYGQWSSGIFIDLLKP